MLPLRTIDKHTTPAGGEASVAFSLAGKVPTGSRHLAVIVNARGDYSAAIDSGTASAGGVNTLTDDADGKAWTPDEHIGRFVYITANTGVGQRREITTNTATVLTVVPNWVVQPDNTSTYEIRDEAQLRVRLNGDSGANYNSQMLHGYKAGAFTNRYNAKTSAHCGYISDTEIANAFGGMEIVIPHAFNTTNHKAILAHGGACETIVGATTSRWANTAAITDLTLFPHTGNFAEGSTFLLCVVDERYLIEEVNLAADGIITFDDIPQVEGDLVVLGDARSDAAAVEDEILQEINDDAVAVNYPSQELIGGGATAVSASQPNQECGIVSGNNATALVFGAFMLTYSQFTKANHPHFISLSGYHETSGPTAEVRLQSGRRASTEAITKLEFYPANMVAGFKAGTLFSLYLVPKRLIKREELAIDKRTIEFPDIPENFEALQLNIHGRAGCLFSNGSFEVGDPPTGWADFAGAGTKSRSNEQVKIGTFSLKMTNTVGNEYLVGQQVPSFAYYSNRKVTVGSWVYATTASRARIGVGDRIADGREYSYSSYHTGNPGWEWLSVTRNLRGSLTELFVLCAITTGAAITAYFDGIILVEGESISSLLADFLFTGNAIACDFSINDDNTDTNFAQQLLSGMGAVVTAERGTSDKRAIHIASEGAAASIFGGGQVLFPAYNKTDGHKHYTILGGASEGMLAGRSGRWKNTAATTKLVLTTIHDTNFKAGTIAELEGILPQKGGVILGI